MIMVPRLVTQTPFELNKIVSYSLITISKSTQTCVILQRKHSVEFLLILSGHYRPSMLLFLLPSTTYDELEILKSLTDDYDYFFHIYVNVTGFDKKDVDYAFIRFIESKEIIYQFKNNNSSELQWTWPKGRLSLEDRENGLLCAYREFYEETEILLPPALYLSEKPILVETIKTLSCKIIETYCWLYVVSDEIPFPPLYNHKEVNDRQWININDALIKLNQTHFLPNIMSQLNCIN